MISMICVYNNQELLDSCLLSTLKGQSYPHEVILMDNSDGKYPSAAVALNQGAKKALGDILIFCHQDMKLESFDTLGQVAIYFERLGDNIIVGPAGKAREYPDSTITNMKHGVVKSYFAGRYSYKDYHESDTLDECLFAVKKKVYEKIQLDESVCNGWHLYAVDYCLTLHSALQTDVFIIDIPAYHYSDASSMNQTYYSTLVKVCKKHKRQYETIYTTMGNLKTEDAFVSLYIQKIKSIIKKLYFSLTGKSLIIHKLDSPRVNI
ncbi:MAG: hypothetical protein JJE17_11665 [Peptostreptococcaceae bacterium]|nr:hypothetical protein [Peptostreptococcaceae bacterium]